MVNVRYISKALILSLSIIVLQSSVGYSARELVENEMVKTATFLSPMFELGPGMVEKAHFWNIDFPRGHLGVKSFDAELVDEAGNPVPLYDTYLHHFFAIKYHENITMSKMEPKPINPIVVKEWKRNAGQCQEGVLSHFWGLGSDSRGTSSKLPDSFAIETGTNIKEGFEERWLFDILAIDTRGVEDPKGCTQCRCDLYNLPSNFFNKTTGIDGKPLTSAYKGGLFCCAQKTQCKLQKGSESLNKRKLAIKYKVTYVDWKAQPQVPIKLYILDVADKVTYVDSKPVHTCMVEYDIPEKVDGPYHIRKTEIPMAKGGNLIYGTAHVHTGIVNATLYGQDGRILCAIKAKYGTGKEPGNEKGYTVGMDVCYPKPGSIKIKDGEILTAEFIHETGYRTGVMGHFYLGLADE